MGQYFKGIILNKKGNLPVMVAESWDTGNGAKLMEHSYIGNTFVGVVERAIISNPQRIVWGGDYADGEDLNSINATTKKKIAKDFETTVDKLVDVNLYNLADYFASRLTVNEEVEDKYKHEYKVLPKRYKYVVNHDRKEFVDKSKVGKGDYGLRINPLPILTCEGNGRGGGDFRGENKLLGLWSRDVISIESRKNDFPKEYKEILFNLKEE